MLLMRKTLQKRICCMNVVIFLWHWRRAAVVIPVWTASEAQLYRKHAQETIHMLDKQDVQARIELLRSTKELIRQAENGGMKRRQSGSEISANRETERRKRT